MRFEESEFIDVSNIPSTFVYFLISDDEVENEVIYVGQTKRGLKRIDEHKKANIKPFNKVYIILCKERDLDDLEKYYITKYAPSYNSVDNPIFDSVLEDGSDGSVSLDWARDKYNQDFILTILMHSFCKNYLILVFTFGIGVETSYRC